MERMRWGATRRDGTTQLGEQRWWCNDSGRRFTARSTSSAGYRPYLLRLSHWMMLVANSTGEGRRRGPERDGAGRVHDATCARGRCAGRVADPSNPGCSNTPDNTFVSICHTVLELCSLYTRSSYEVSTKGVYAMSEVLSGSRASAGTDGIHAILAP